MRAAIMRSGAIVVDDVPDLEPRAGHVLVKTLACGICGSDLHALHHAHDLVRTQTEVGGSMTFEPDRDVIMGHEFCAEVLDPGASSMREGDRVCSMPLAFAEGSPVTIGYSNDMPGGFAEQMWLSEAMVLPVPNGLDAKMAAMTEPMAVGRHAVEKANPSPEDVSLVIGCGPVGLAVVAALKQKGLGPVFAADFSARRRQLAEMLGADVVIDPAETSPYEAWTDAAWPSGSDRLDPMIRFSGVTPKPGLVFECVGIPGVMAQVMTGSMRNSRIVVVGVCMESDTITPLMGISKELNLQFVLGYTADEFSDTLRGIAEGELDVEPLITGTVGLDGVAEAFDILAGAATSSLSPNGGDADEHAKIMVLPDQ